MAIYSDAHRDAIVRAALEHGDTVRQAVEKAAAGELGCDAFEVPLGTAQGWVAKAKREETAGNYCHRLERVAARLLDSVEAQVDEIDNRRAKGEDAAVQTKRAAIAAQEVQKLVTLIESAATSKPAEADTPGEPARIAQQHRPSQLVEEMMAELERTKRDGPGEEAAPEPSSLDPARNDPDLEERYRVARKLGLEAYLPEARDSDTA